jgi:hypothetical protein
VNLGLELRSATSIANRLDSMQMFNAERKAANFNVAALRYGQPSLCLKYNSSDYAAARAASISLSNG